jgi:hypothetical protein
VSVRTVPEEGQVRVMVGGGVDGGGVGVVGVLDPPHAAEVRTAIQVAATATERIRTDSAVAIRNWKFEIQGGSTSGLRRAEIFERARRRCRRRSVNFECQISSCHLQ